MSRDDAGTTNPALLNRLGNWQDREAWFDFAARYDPLIRLFCRTYRFDADGTEELCQRIWIDLAQRMRTFRYDPGKRFRGWLHSLCLSRAIDALRRQKTETAESLEDQRAEWFGRAVVFDRHEELDSDRPLLLRQAEEVQEAVRRRVGERTWQVFWSIAIAEQSVRETADTSGVSYAAAFATQKRVSRMLQEERRRVLAEQQKSENLVEPQESL
jgi:RNA polymerase sigma factor (sigma-70 family)